MSAYAIYVPTYDQPFGEGRGAIPFYAEADRELIWIAREAQGSRCSLSS